MTASTFVLSLRKLLWVGSLLCAAHSAWAIDGTITFSGTITANTCTISNGTQTVTLPTVSTSALASANATAGTTSFSIALSGCGSIVGAKPFFEYGSTVNTNGRLTKVTGTSNNVEIQLLAPDFSVINLNSQSITPVTISAGSGTVTLYARYFATAAASAGTISTNVTFSMIYN